MRLIRTKSPQAEITRRVRPLIAEVYTTRALPGTNVSRARTGPGLGYCPQLAAVTAVHASVGPTDPGWASPQPLLAGSYDEPCCASPLPQRNVPSSFPLSLSMIRQATPYPTSNFDGPSIKMPS